jgi:amidophosphoribosyltransferase
MCGILGIVGREDVVTELHPGLLTLQHRGQDAAGIATYDTKYHIKKGSGLVRDIFTLEDFSLLKGKMGVAQARYPTVGFGGEEDAQPILLSAPFGIAIVHNGNVTNIERLKQEIDEKTHANLTSSNDVELILHVLADELTKQDLSSFHPRTLFRAVKGVFDRVEGSYSVIALIAGKGLLGFRDPNGIRPLIFGERKERYPFRSKRKNYPHQLTLSAEVKDYALASESVALDSLGYKTVRDIEPGEAIFISHEKKILREIIKGESSSILMSEGKLNSTEGYPCIFEYVYFARPDSVMNGISVYESRLRLGEVLAEDCKNKGIKPDVVIPVPDTARTAALSVARILNLPYQEGLIKNRYIGRTFIMPNQDMREVSVKQKLNPIKIAIKGKKVLLVDDSIVRGTTSRQIIEMVRESGAKEVYYAVTCPPLKYPCIYGIDMSTRGEFVARRKSIEKIRETIGADRLIYQTLEGMKRAVRGTDKKRNFCTACFNKKYPSEMTRENFMAIERERISSKKAGVI